MAAGAGKRGQMSEKESDKICRGEREREREHERRVVGVFVIFSQE